MQGSLEEYTKILKGLGFNEQEIVRYSVLLGGFLSEYIHNKAMIHLSDREVKALERQAYIDDLDTEEKMSLIQLAYEDKTGLTLEQELDNLALEFANVLRESVKNSREFISKFKNLKEEEQLSKLREILLKNQPNE